MDQSESRIHRPGTTARPVLKSIVDAAVPRALASAAAAAGPASYNQQAGAVAWPATPAESQAASPLQLTTLAAGDASLSLVQLVRAAHSASCEAGGPMELLLREAIADAQALADRLATLAQFAREGR